MDIHYSERVFKRIENEKMIATVVVDDLEAALPLAETLYEAGVGCIELTLRTDCALKAIERIAGKLPDILVGAGTVLSPEQLVAVKDAGADFAVSPGIDPLVLEKALAIELPFSPGVMTPSDIQLALNYNYKNLKFFPAEPSGGISFLKCMAAPYQHMDIRFIPLGGIHEDNYLNYLKEDLVIAVGGSWIAPRSKIIAQDWEGIRDCCYQCRSKIDALQNIVTIPKTIKKRIASTSNVQQGAFEEILDLNQITR